MPNESTVNSTKRYEPKIEFHGGRVILGHTRELYDAIMAGDFATVKKAIDNGADFKTDYLIKLVDDRLQQNNYMQFPYYLTALEVALIYLQKDIFEYMLNKNAKIIDIENLNYLIPKYIKAINFFSKENDNELYGFYSGGDSKKGIYQEMLNLLVAKGGVLNCFKAEDILNRGVQNGNLNAIRVYFTKMMKNPDINLLWGGIIKPQLVHKNYQCLNMFMRTSEFKEYISELEANDKNILHRSLRKDKEYMQWLKSEVLDKLLPVISSLKHADATKKDSALIESNEYVKNRFQAYPYEVHLRDSIIPEAFPELTQYQCKEAAKMVVKAYDMLKIKSNDSRKRKRDEVDESSTNKRAKDDYCSRM